MISFMSSRVFERASILPSKYEPAAATQLVLNQIQNGEIHEIHDQQRIENVRPFPHRAVRGRVFVPCRQRVRSSWNNRRSVGSGFNSARWPTWRRRTDQWN